MKIWANVNAHGTPSPPICKEIFLYLGGTFVNGNFSKKGIYRHIVQPVDIYFVKEQEQWCQFAFNADAVTLATSWRDEKRRCA